MQNNILIIDDDIELCNLLKRCVEKEGITADLAHTGEIGLQLGLKGNYHLIVLDIMLPEIDGYQVLEKIRNICMVPVLMLTAKVSSTDKVNCLRSGADDYLTKPFDVEEFTARVLSLIRRYTTLNTGSVEENNCLVFKGLEIDMDKRIVITEHGQIDLLPKEFNILCYLAQNQGKILTKKQIYEEVWQEEYAYEDNNIMVYISRLRKNIEYDSSSPVYIQTVKGVGYRFSREV